MDTDEQHSTSGKGVPHTRHTVRGCCRLIPNPGSLTFNGCNPPAMRACVLRIRTAVVASVLRIWHYHRACELCTVVFHVPRRRLPHTPPARPATATSVDPCC